MSPRHGAPGRGGARPTRPGARWSAGSTTTCGATGSAAASWSRPASARSAPPSSRRRSRPWPRSTRFDRDDDPYGEHDFGALTVAGVRLLWKVDYYDAAMTGGSPDPADPSVTTRVLTVMLAHEW